MFRLAPPLDVRLSFKVPLLSQIPWSVSPTLVEGQAKSLLADWKD